MTKEAQLIEDNMSYKGYLLWIFKSEEESKMSTIHWLPSTSIINRTLEL